MPNGSAIDSIAKRWIGEVQHLWQVHDNLLNNYRTYLIVLNSLLAAGSCTIMVRLSYVIADDPPKLNGPSVKLSLIVIMIVLLALFIGVRVWLDNIDGKSNIQSRV